MNMLNKLCILELNKNWFPITLKTPKKVFESFSSGNLLGLHMDWENSDVENEDFSTPTELTPLKWEDWIQLPVRDFDMAIRTPKMEIRIPSIVICTKFSEIPNKPPKLSKKNIMLRDGYTCQYDGKTYPKSELNIDHVIPRSRGGRNDWDNLVTCHRRINTNKANRTPAEAGLALIRKPKMPTATSIFFADKMTDPKWKMFMNYLN
jgi:5-methylcytosine-specific restriction endonuclease McrA